MSNIDHPAHYNHGKIEVIDVIEDWGLGFHLGNAVKYIGRAGHKGNEAEDIEKAIWYLERYLVTLAEDTVATLPEDFLANISSAARAAADAIANWGNTYAGKND